MTDDLVKRLRVEQTPIYVSSVQTMFDAADRIEKLEAALREIAWIATPDHAMARSKATHIARKALRGER
jgi:hypothetical protein